MAKRIEFTNDQKDEIRRTFNTKLRKLKNANSVRRLTALNMRRLDKTNREISELTGFNIQYITDLVSKYRRCGLAAILKDNRTTTHNRRMSFEEETKFLEQFCELAEAGQIISVMGILEKFEEVTGKKSNTSTIYKLLKRHGWRKVKPRPRHPNSATEEEKDSSKKLTQNGSKSYWKNIP